MLRVVLFSMVWATLTFGFASYGCAQVSRDEEVIFYGPYLYWSDSGNLAMVLRGRLVEPERRGLGRRIAIDRAIGPSIYRYIGKAPADFDAQARQLMVERLLPFLADGESGEVIKLRVVGNGGSSFLTLPKTDAGGHFVLGTTQAGKTPLADLAGDGLDLQVQAVLPADDARRFSVRLRVPPRKLPRLVISDVDDTVRIAEVLDRPRMIERVFLRPYEAVPGMAEIYRQLAQRGAHVHFVSGSPWQIGLVIEQFLAEHDFPPAVLHCRQVGWDFWNGDPLHTKEFKVATIKSLLQQFPSNGVLLIGDDGEHDPEVYTEICRSAPSEVAGIWIRHVSSRATEERLAEVRQLLGPGRVVAFDQASELQAAIEMLDRN